MDNTQPSIAVGWIGFVLFMAVIGVSMWLIFAHNAVGLITSVSNLMLIMVVGILVPSALGAGEWSLVMGYLFQLGGAFAYAIVHRTLVKWFITTPTALI